MKVRKILPLLPMLGLLAACSQDVSLTSSEELAGTKKTEAPRDFVVYPDDRPSVPDGKLVFEKQNCASCHGADGAGGSGPALNDKLKMYSVKPVDMYKSLTYGEKDFHHMQGKISNRETWDLVFYTRALANPLLSQAEYDAIQPVFGSNCAVCHGTKGDGEGPLARNLEPNPANFQTFKRFYDRTDDTLYDHIANGIKWEGMPNFLGKEDRKKNVKFDHEYIRKLVQYVRAYHVSNEPTNPDLLAASAGAAKAPATTAASGEKKTAEVVKEKSEAQKSEKSSAEGHESASQSKGDEAKGN